MCVIIVDVALCDSPCPYADVPSGCLKVYPYTYSESTCEETEGVLGSCGNVEMQKREDKEGGRIEKRVCEACVAWSALMRDKDGRRARRSFRRPEPLRSNSDLQWQAAIMTPPDSAESSDFETEVESTGSSTEA